MIDEFIKTLPLALCAAVNPVGILILVAVLVAGAYRIKKSLSYVLGFFITFFALGIALLFVINKIATKLQSDSGRIMCDVDWVILAGVVLYFGYKIIQKHRGKEKIEKNTPKLDRSNSWLAYGALYALTDITSLIPYAILLKDVATTKINFFDKTISILLTNVVVAIPLLVLPLICVIFPKRSDAILTKIRSVLSGHKKTVSIVIMIIIVVYLAYKISKCLA